MVRPLNRSEVDPVEVDACRMRTAAGIPPDGVVPDVVTVLRHLGLLVAVRDLGDRGPDGIYASPERGGVVVLNSARTLYRVRRVAGHLLAHRVYGDRPHVDRDIDAAPDDLAQCRANAFAVRFLISRDALLARREAPGCVAVSRTVQLAVELGVGYRVLAERLRDLAAQPPGPPSQIPNAGHPSHSAR